MIRAVLFDLDGTLVDTAPDLGAAANHVRTCLGLAPLPLADYRPVASAGARGLLHKALGITPEHADFAAHRERFLAHYRAHLADMSRPFAGVVELLHALGRRGLHWGVVTNKPSFLTLPLMAQLGLSPPATCTVSADQVARPKPAPDSLHLACELLRLDAAACIYVGDDRRDIDAGHAAGMLTAAADWGYRGDNGPIETWGASGIVRSPGELLRWLD